MTIKTIQLISSILLFFPILLPAQSVLDQGSALPLFVVDTDGSDILNEPKIEAHLGIIYTPDSLNYLTDIFNIYDGRIGIEIRGNGTVNLDKVSYLFETQLENGENNNVSLLEFPEENDWVLYGPYIDKSLLRNVLTYDLARAMGYYASRVQPCELVINGDYLGVYIFMEKIKRDKNRVDLKKFDDPNMLPSEGGFLFKIDSWWNSNIGWQSATYNVEGQERKWNYHYLYPKANEITEGQKSYLKNFVDNFENNLLSLQETGNPAVYDLIDIENFADYFIINELAKNPDAYRLSTYLHKDAESEDDRLKLGPVWDYNFGFSNYWDYKNRPSGWEYDNHWWDFPDQIPFWWSVLLEDPYFTNILKERWTLWRNSVINCANFTSQIDHWKSLISPAAERNFTRWPVLGQPHILDWYVGDTYAEEVDYLNNWICQRIAWMDQELDYLDTDIPPIFDAQSYSVYPNPAVNYLIIQSQDTFPNYLHTVRVYDPYQRLQWEETLVPQFNDNKIHIALPNLTTGIFILELSSTQSSTRWKFFHKN